MTHMTHVEGNIPFYSNGLILNKNCFFEGSKKQFL